MFYNSLCQIKNILTKLDSTLFFEWYWYTITLIKYPKEVKGVKSW